MLIFFPESLKYYSGTNLYTRNNNKQYKGKQMVPCNITYMKNTEGIHATKQKVKI